MDSLQSSSPSVSRRKPESLDKIKKAARKLFVERGYHATRPQDIARDAGLGHGTFYLHYGDKRACFLAFVDDAQAELYGCIRARTRQSNTIEEMIANMLGAIYDYSDANPGVLNAIMTDEAIIDAGGCQAGSLLQRLAYDWAEIVREGVSRGTVVNIYDANIVGQVIVGAIQQCRLEGDRSGQKRQDVIATLTRFLVRALKP
jgi:AcrR family transcriptional regulator